MEEVNFNHYKKRWGKHFSHVEIRKKDVSDFLSNLGDYSAYKGYETAKGRETFDIKKISQKSKSSKESHANDGLAMNSLLFEKKPFDKNCDFIHWLPNTTVKRQLHKMTYKKGGIRQKQGSTSRNSITKGSYAFSKKFGNCWIQGFRSKGKNCYLMNSDKKRIGEQVENRLTFLYRSSILFSINYTE